MARFSFIALIVGVLVVGTLSANPRKNQDRKQISEGEFYDCYRGEGEQIPVENLCDGFADCTLQDDEWWCGGSESYDDLPPVPDFAGFCEPGEFMCRDSSCVDGWCDGVIDCEDAEDETHCGVGPYFNCQTDDDSEYLIHMFEVCDNVADCQYNDDESICGWDTRWESNFSSGSSEASSSFSSRSSEASSSSSW